MQSTIDNQMTTYGFRLRFLLPKDSMIHHDEETLELSSGDVTLLLQSPSKTSIGDSRELLIRGSGFPSKDEAYACGRRTKNALILCGACLRMGFDVGKDKATSGVGKIVKERAREKGIVLLDDVHGLSVFPEDMPVKFVSFGGSVVVGPSAAIFVEEFGKAYEMSPEFTDKQSLAFELYSAAQFESSLRARFLTLVIAVECLSSLEEQPQRVVNHVKELVALTKKSFKGPEKGRILSHLGELKKESISKSCRDLVGKHLGAEVAKLFEECYDARGKIVHDGEPPEGFDLGTYVPKLDELASQLLIAVVTSG